MAKVVHLTSVHDRHDVRIYDKQLMTISKVYETKLIVADGLGYSNGDIEIIDVGKPANRFIRIFCSTWLVFLYAFKERASIYQFHDPELMAVGLLLKGLGFKVVYDMHENTDLQILEKLWLPVWVRRPMSYSFSLFEKMCCRFYDAILVPQYKMVDKYSLEGKTVPILNFPKTRSSSSPELKSSRFEIIYSGSMSDARGFRNMLHTMEHLVKLDERYNLNLAGRLSSEQRLQIESSIACDNIKILGYLSRDALYRVYSECSIGLILFNNVGQYGMAYALKLFEYMENSLTIILPDFGDWLDFNEKNEVGICVDTTNTAKVASEIVSLADDVIVNIGKKNRSLLLDKFNWDSEGNKLLDLYGGMNR